MCYTYTIHCWFELLTADLDWVNPKDIVGSKVAD